MIDAPECPERAELDENYQFGSIIGCHPKLIDILNLVAQVADTDATILIYGESGTGKELISRALHENSSRRHKPFVPLNCGALPDHLLESEFFGHLRGAFTGAIREKQGWFGYATGGTILLDEIHALSPAMQMKLLRILQTGEYTPIGSTEFRKSDVRILAATSKNLSDLITREEFREELFYRINVIDITLPPLRERKSDIALLVQHYLRMFAAKYKKGTLQLSPEAKVLLCSYDFPGNIRELRNIIQKIVILATERMIKPENLPDEVVEQDDARESGANSAPFKKAKQIAVEKFERYYITECLRATKGNISHAASQAGIHVTHLHTKLKQYNIDPNLFKIGKLNR